MDTTKIWKVDNGNLYSLEKKVLPFEDYIQKWVEADISIISDNLIFIGSQVHTQDNTIIDILAIDKEGDLVIIELKKDKTPRDVVSQALDYAASCSKLGENEINEIIKIKTPKTLEELLIEKGCNYEDIEINENQKMLIVGSNIDAATERIVRYLASKEVQINVATFAYYEDNNEKYLARNVLLEDQEIVISDKTKKKRNNSFFISLFESKKLTTGMELYFKPGISKGYTKDSEEIKATIKNTTNKCLLYKDGNLYSFSRLRKKLIMELSIENINPDWGYGLKNDWCTPDGKSISELGES